MWTSLEITAFRSFQCRVLLMLQSSRIHFRELSAFNFVVTFLFKHSCSPVYKATSTKTWFEEFGIGEQNLWDVLEC